MREVAVHQEMSQVEPQVTEPEPEVEQKTLPESVLELSPSPSEPVEEPMAVVVESKVEEAEKIVVEADSEPILELSPLPLPQLPPEPVSDVHIFIQQPSVEIVDREVADVVMEEPVAEAESADPPVATEETAEVQEAEEAEAAAKPATFADRSRRTDFIRFNTQAVFFFSSTFCFCRMTFMLSRMACKVDIEH